MFEELSDKLPALLACGNTGVLVALAKACLRLKAKQTQYINVSVTELSFYLSLSMKVKSQIIPPSTSLKILQLKIYFRRYNFIKIYQK